MLLASCEVGVGQFRLSLGSSGRRVVVELPNFTASVRLTPACALLPGRLREPAPLASPAVGVGHICAAVASRSPKPFPLLCFLRCTSRRTITDSGDSVRFITAASGVGHKPDAFAEMGGAEVGRREAIPFRIEPDFGQVSDHVSKAPSKQTWDVLHEDESGS